MDILEWTQSRGEKTWIKVFITRGTQAEEQMCWQMF